MNYPQIQLYWSNRISILIHRAKPSTFNNSEHITLQCPKMSSTSIIALIIVLITAFLGYAAIAQTLEQKRKQKQRLISALRQRSKDFRQMCSGFPQGFLSKELNVLVNKCLVDVTEHLIRLEPNETGHSQAAALYRDQLENAKRQTKLPNRTHLENPSQIKDVKTLLQGLSTFLGNQQQSGNITTAQFNFYQTEIKQMVVRLSVDTYIINARQSESAEKERLAIHFYDLARQLLLKESDSNEQLALLTKINRQIEKLEGQCANKEPEYEIDLENKKALEATKDEWKAFTEEGSDNSWKKKTQYD